MLICELELHAAQDDAELAQQQVALAQLETQQALQQQQALKQQLASVVARHDRERSAANADQRAGEANVRRELAAAHEQVGALRAQVHNYRQN